jgi:diguanylate cyclase (GGDEF)-like protein
MEAARMRDLANAAVEGLLVCARETIVTANNSFAALMDSPLEQIVGTKLDKYFIEAAMLSKLFAQSNEPLETELRRADGSAIPVELIIRPIDFGGKPHQAIAVRDLRRRRKAEQHIQYLAHHDALTGIANRNSFTKQLDKEIEAAVAASERLAVLCLDLDRFKEVNDLFGHAAGDAMLQTVATCVGGILEADQMLARLGGDEFAIIIPRISGPAVAGRIAENILEALRTHNESATTGALLSSSIGIAVCPHDGTDRQSLLKHADTALYRAKADGRATYRFFEASMGEEVRDRRLLEHDLRHAIGRQELSLMYQPQNDIKTGIIIGFEALLRWQHQTRGNVPPSVFIPIAEESGAILQIGEWVLRTACHEAATWTQPLSVAVNVSAVQLHNAGFPQLVHEVLFRTGLKPHRLELEITETSLIRDLNRALSTLRQLKTLGVRIAMDDFGTGYSSLSNLRAFPFDKIKIDGSFIKSVNTNSQAATIVRAVLCLGRGLGLPVLAEGVETPGELKFLVDEHCDEAQGYHLGRPAPVDQLRHLTHGKTAAVPPLPVELAQRTAYARVKESKA